METLLLIIGIIVAVALVICSIALGWHLRIKKELEQEKGGCITLEGDVTANQYHYYVRILESDTLVEHLRIPRDKHTLDVSAYQMPVEITIKIK